MMTNTFKYLASTIIALGLLGSSTSSYALFAIQGLYGQKTAKFSGALDGDDAEGTQMKFAAHIDPLPLPMITLGFGLSFSLIDYDVNGQQGISETVSSTTYAVPFTELTGYAAGPEIFFGVSIPTVDLMPYLRLTYAISAITGKGDVSVTDGVTIDTETSVDFAMVGAGLNYGIGVAYSPLPLLAILLEYEIAEDDMVTPSVDQGDISVPELEGKISGSSILFGVQFGI